MHAVHPITERFSQHPAQDRIVGIDRISATGIVGKSTPVGRHDVVHRSGLPFEIEPGTYLARFGGMVVNHVQDHLHPGAVESLDHVPKFAHRLQRVVRRPVIPVRGEEIDGGIAPVVFQAGRSILRIEGKDRHQFHGRYPEGLQIRDLLYRRRKCPRAHARDPGIGMSRKALDMHLVDHRVRKGDPGMAVALPVVSSAAHHHTFDGGSEIVPAVARGLCTAVIFPVKSPGKGVGKQFRTVEIQTFAGQVVAVHPIAVVQALACPMHQHMPIVVRTVFFGSRRMI